MHIYILMDSSFGKYLPTFQDFKFHRNRPKNDKFIVGESNFLDQNHSSMKVGISRALEIFLIPTPNSMFHQDWSRNVQVINGKPQTVTIERKTDRNLSKLQSCPGGQLKNHEMPRALFL